MARFIREDINCINANKSVLSGIEEVARLMKQGRFFVSRAGITGVGDDGEKLFGKFFDEIYQYVWDEKTGEPVKLNDDVMDAIRYAIYSQHHKSVEIVTDLKW